MPKTLDRVDKMLLIQDQINELRQLKGKLAVKIPCNNKAGYDFTTLKNLEYRINFPAGKLKNSEGQTLTEAMGGVSEKFQRVLMEFENAFKKEVEKIYQNPGECPL